MILFPATCFFFWYWTFTYFVSPHFGPPDFILCSFFFLYCRSANSLITDYVLVLYYFICLDCEFSFLFLGVKMKMNIAGIVSNYFYNACNCFPSFLSIHLEMCFVLHKRGCTYSSKIPKTVQAQYLYKKCASRTSAINSRKKQRRWLEKF